MPTRWSLDDLPQQMRRHLGLSFSGFAITMCCSGPRAFERERAVRVGTVGGAVEIESGAMGGVHAIARSLHCTCSRSAAAAGAGSCPAAATEEPNMTALTLPAGFPYGEACLRGKISFVSASAPSARRTRPAAGPSETVKFSRMA